MSYSPIHCVNFCNASMNKTIGKTGIAATVHRTVDQNRKKALIIARGNESDEQNSLIYI